jgi:hypothetical protein
MKFRCKILDAIKKCTTKTKSVNVIKLQFQKLESADWRLVLEINAPIDRSID